MVASSLACSEHWLLRAALRFAKRTPAAATEPLLAAGDDLRREVVPRAVVSRTVPAKRTAATRAIRIRRACNARLLATPAVIVGNSISSYLPFLAFLPRPSEPPFFFLSSLFLPPPRPGPSSWSLFLSVPPCRGLSASLGSAAPNTREHSATNPSAAAPDPVAAFRFSRTWLRSLPAKNIGGTASSNSGHTRMRAASQIWGWHRVGNRRASSVPRLVAPLKLGADPGELRSQVGDLRVLALVLGRRGSRPLVARHGPHHQDHRQWAGSNEENRERGRNEARHHDKDHQGHHARPCEHASVQAHSCPLDSGQLRQPVV